MAHSEFPGRIEPGVILGSYEILLCAARGGMASVWAAQQHGARGFSKLVALKTILPDLQLHEFESMFMEEARIAARIHHPNVCEIIELIEHDGTLALSMEWMDGESLARLITGPTDLAALDPRIAARIVADAARGLHAAHELCNEFGQAMNVVHRDVSPQNILISRAGHVKVADFGIAKALGSMREATAVGRVKGKLNYMSPEQARGLPLDRRSDIFSLGVVLYMATLGCHPFRRSRESTYQQLTRLLSGDIVLPSQIVADYPIGLESILLRATSNEPAYRFESAAQLRMELEEWLARTGPLVTEQDVARVLHQRLGTTIESRATRIQACVQAIRAREATSSFKTYHTPFGFTSPAGVPIAVEHARKPRGVPSRERSIWGAAIVLGIAAGLGVGILGFGNASRQLDGIVPSSAESAARRPSAEPPAVSATAAAESTSVTAPSDDYQTTAASVPVASLSTPAVVISSLPSRRSVGSSARAKPNSQKRGAAPPAAATLASARAPAALAPVTRTPAATGSAATSKPPAKTHDAKRIGPLETDL